ncbi:MAG TPA: acylphosphatase [Bryobacterales bacterium]|nr:acylphosphatase [Bryobacterales bacterium]
MQQQGLTARLYRVRGLVQGVGFRWYVQRAAAELGLTGYVKNLDDGRVEVYAVGPQEKLSELARRLWKGPAHADVRGVEEQEAPVERSGSFRVEPSW